MDECVAWGMRLEEQLVAACEIGGGLSEVRRE